VGGGWGTGAPHFHRGVAQLAERWSPKPEVASSIPAAPADCVEYSHEIALGLGKAKT
jgi:hypothetical protein